MDPVNGMHYLLLKYRLKTAGRNITGKVYKCT